jgi:hypothetical protein
MGLELPDMQGLNGLRQSCLKRIVLGKVMQACNPSLGNLVRPASQNKRSEDIAQC